MANAFVPSPLGTTLQAVPGRLRVDVYLGIVPPHPAFGHFSPRDKGHIKRLGCGEATSGISHSSCNLSSNSPLTTGPDAEV
jgi:hypothetical protein